MLNPTRNATDWHRVVRTVRSAIDLDATARRSGALIRRRGVRRAETLLRLALAYGPGGLSLQSAAAWAEGAGVAAVSDTALMNRLRGAAGWLGEITEALLQRAPAAPTSGGPLPGRRLRIADATTVVAPGGQPTWRLHAAYDPAAGRFTKLDLTDEHGAESFTRIPWSPGEVAIGDRCYARPPALRQVLACGADFIVRTGWRRLRLLDAAGQPLDWDRVFDTLGTDVASEQVVQVDTSGQGGKSRGDQTFPARLIVQRLRPEAAERAAKAQHRVQSRTRRNRPLQPTTVRATGYLMLITSLPPEVTVAQVLDAFRLRWQVELAFKRLKSLLGFDRLPAKGETLARSWLLAHLILALITEDKVDQVLAFPPSAGRQGPASLTLAADAAGA